METFAFKGIKILIIIPLKANVIYEGQFYKQKFLPTEILMKSNFDEKKF